MNGIYKQSSVSGTQYQRANTIIIANPLNGTPSIDFAETTVTELGNATFEHPCSNLSIQYDAAASFPLLDPETGEPVSPAQSITYQQVNQILYSLYMAASAARDAAAKEQSAATQS